MRDGEGAQDGTGARSLGRREWLVLLAILGAALLVHARGLAGELVYDDLLLIARNPDIADLGNVPRLFGSGYWDFLGLRDVEYIGYWRPLPALLHALVWPLAGGEPTAFHALSLAFHLAATAAAFALARRLGAGPWVAACAALLFALHPAQVENVAWISALSGPLSGFLVFLSLERFLAWRERGSRGLPLVAAALFALALLAKEIAAALLPMLLVADLLRRRGAPDERRIERRIAPPEAPARAYVPFAAAFALYLVARMLVFRSPWAGLERVTVDFDVGALRLALLRVELLGGALEILAAPVELVLLRPFRPYVALTDPALVRAAVFCAVLAAALFAAWRGRRRLALVALAFVPLGLLPALVNVQSLGQFPLSERFLYLPALGFALGAALFLARSLPPRAATALALVVAGLYAARTWTRTGDWRDEEALFRRSAEQAPRSPTVQWSLGRVLLARFGETRPRDPRLLAEAAQAFERAAALLDDAKAPDTDVMASSRDHLQVNLGLAWCAIEAADYSAAILVLQEVARRIEEIRAQEREALARGYDVREQFLELERVYTALGVAQSKSGEHAEAERSFARALELQPGSPEAHQNLGRMYAEQRRWAEAAAEFESAARLRPGVAEDRLLLAQALQTMGESERAEALAHELVDELPERAGPLLVLAATALARGDSSAALTLVQRALEREPDNSLAWYHRARAYLMRAEHADALAAFRRAIDLDPAGFEAHYDLASFLLAQGAVAEAVPYVVRAYVLAPQTHRPPLRQNLQRMELEAEQLDELARVDAARGELEAALDWRERELARAPERGAARERGAAPDHDAALERARLLRRLERHDQAVAALRECAERAPEDYELWSELGSYLHSLGRAEEARPAIERALGLARPAAMPARLFESSQERLRALLE